MGDDWMEDTGSEILDLGYWMGDIWMGDDWMEVIGVGSFKLECLQSSRANFKP